MLVYLKIKNLGILWRFELVCDQDEGGECNEGKSKSFTTKTEPLNRI